MKEQPHSLLLHRLKAQLVHFRQLSARVAENYIRPMLLKRFIQHVSGPKTVEYGRNEVLALCVVRNGAAYIRSFVQHHFELGVRHIVFLDNGSTDDTVAIAQEYDNITILEANCPYHKYENVMKRYLAHRFSQGKWALFVDIDELFDYPFSDVLSLPSLIAYLNHYSYTAVVAQMLDMFPDTTLSGLWTMTTGDCLKEAYPYYDVSNIRKSDYLWGKLSNPSVKRYHGGIRDTLFGTNNGLTKVALFFVDEHIDLFVKWHHVNNAYIADFTGVLLHYPFVSSFSQKVLEAVETRRYGYFTIQYELYWKTLQEDPQRRIRLDTAHVLTTIKSLLDTGFLVASPNFLQWVAVNRKNL